MNSSQRDLQFIHMFADNLMYVKNILVFCQACIVFILLIMMYIIKHLKASPPPPHLTDLGPFETFWNCFEAERPPKSSLKQVEYKNLMFYRSS